MIENHAIGIHNPADRSGLFRWSRHHSQTMARRDSANASWGGILDGYRDGP
jgi:hypothetical protein